MINKEEKKEDLFHFYNDTLSDKYLLTGSLLLANRLEKKRLKKKKKKKKKKKMFAEMFIFQIDENGVHFPFFFFVFVFLMFFFCLFVLFCFIFLNKKWKTI